MWEKLFDLIIGFWDSIKLFQITDEYERGIKLRWGRYKCEIYPGRSWKLPFIDELFVEDTRTDVLNLPTQSITTKDDVSLSISLIVRYRILDVRAYTLNIKDEDNVLGDMAQGITEELITRHIVSQIKNPSIKLKIKKEVNKQCGEYGFIVISINFADNTKAKSIRLLTD